MRDIAEMAAELRRGGKLPRWVWRIVRAAEGDKRLPLTGPQRDFIRVNLARALEEMGR